MLAGLPRCGSRGLSRITCHPRNWTSVADLSADRIAEIEARLRDSPSYRNIAPRLARDATWLLAALRGLRERETTLTEALSQLADKWESEAQTSLRDFGVPTQLAPLQAVRELRAAIETERVNDA